MPVSYLHALFICAGAFMASVFGVVVGGHSFITVPLMILWGLQPAAAVATNRFSTLFLSVFGLRNFHRYGKLDLRFSLPFALAAVVGSAIGSLVVLRVDQLVLKRLISTMMLALVVLTLSRPNIGVEESVLRRGLKWILIGLPISFVLGLYWGFFGGGGTTLFTFFLVSVYGMRFLEGAANSNLIGFSASLIAAAVFIAKGAIHYSLAVPVGVAMGIGGYVGSWLSVKVGNLWIRRIFLVVVILLAIRLLLS